ncbi:SSU ribosomal protein S18P alanine acetyltransferase [Candidatus Sulfopaludibacter sp. SbA6]|nr:SSU ribosomal protein S18P alanine acetyltransferase [Candidatus Sulfopaludibacter sp. SbA6]
MAKRYSVRKLRPSDLDRILEIEHASFGKDAYDRNLFAEFFHKCGDLFLVAETGSGVCGYIVTCIRGNGPPCGTNTRAELVSVAVHPDHRGRGAASALMDSTLRRLRLRGVVRLGLMVRAANRKALAFYEKYGFQKVRIVRGYYEDHADGLLMAKNLHH